MGKPVVLLVKEIYYTILAAVGLPANLMTIIILTRGNCGLSKCITAYMVAMATADLLTIINNVMVYYIFSYHFPLSFLAHTPVCRTILYMTTVNLDNSVWFTVSFTFDRFVAICCQKLKTRLCTKRVAVAIVTTASILILLKDIPVLFAYEPQHIINKVHWGCQSSVAFLSSSPGIAYVWFHSAWVVWLPFTLIFMFNILTVRRILIANRARTELRGHRCENRSDSESENRRKSVILLFTISISFILLWLTYAVSLVTTKLDNSVYYRDDRTNPAYIATETGAFLKYLSCFQNPCIYTATQSKFRQELKNVVKTAWTLMLRLVEKLRIKGMRFINVPPSRF
ncbi:probable G-protein coupled receptor 139 [Scyliorhinus torazame]|uniref:probable G-protein coupled receptor 139 n=1 Tax=Scyliorhinus torazame TaxID=75743 RepID=UPI003B597BD1